jgi:hypothetical protein
MKNELCAAAGLELLRIEFSALVPGPRKRLIVEYLIDARSFIETVDRMQEAGELPLDEPFDYRWVIGRADSGRLEMINDLAQPARLAVLEAGRTGQICGSHIHGIHFSWKDGRAEGWAWVEARSDLLLFHAITVRS